MHMFRFHSHICYINIFFFYVLIATLLTRVIFVSTTRGDNNDSRVDCGKYILFFDTCLHPTRGVVAAVGELRRQWGWRHDNCKVGHLLLDHQPPTVAWQDFAVVRVASHEGAATTLKCIKKRLNHTLFLLPDVGLIAVIAVVGDVVLPGHRVVASSSLPRGDNISSARWLYPRRYFNLPTRMRWTGKGVRIAILDIGLDAHLLHSSPSSPLGGQNSSTTTTTESPPLRLCTSFVPGVLCENSKDGHGTFAVSVMAGNISFAGKSNVHYNDANRCHHFKKNETGNIGVSTDESSYSGFPSFCMPYLGMAPEADVHMLRVFDDNLESRTSWCLEALNAALQWGANVVSLSFGGIDYHDSVFTDKITELAERGLVVVAATGNEGPELGSVHNPADQTEVIAVGSLGTFGRCISVLSATNDAKAANASCKQTAARWVSMFSGRGPSTWELPYGEGRIRPDLVALGEHVVGLGRSKGGDGPLTLKVLHGTSVAAPLVAGVVALCIDAIRQLGFNEGLQHNVAVIKRVLMDTAVEIRPTTSLLSNISAIRVMAEALRRMEGKICGKSKFERFWLTQESKLGCFDGVSMAKTLFYFRNVLQYSHLSQGAGEVCPLCALLLLESQQRKSIFLDVFAFPKEIDATGAHQLLDGEDSDGEHSQLPPCLHNWPYCEQPLFPSAAPVAFNVSVYHPQCPAARLVATSPRVTVTAARGLCSANRRGKCQPSAVRPAAAKRLLFLRAGASRRLKAYSGWISLFAFSPSNASNVLMEPSISSSPPFIAASGSQKVLGYFDLVEVSGTVVAEYTCGLTFSVPEQERKQKSAEETKKGEENSGANVLRIPFKISVVPRPHRAKRVAFDVDHQWFYPSDFVPGDDAHSTSFSNKHTRFGDYWRRPKSHGAFECHCDHPHTNMAPLMLYLRRVMGFFVEIPKISYLSFYLSGVAMPLNAQNHAALRRYYRSIGILLLFDPELPFVMEERAIIADAVLRHNLHILLISEWYSEQVAEGLSFYDLSRDRMWRSVFCTENNETVGPSTTTAGIFCAKNKTPRGLKGACHVPSLNKLLSDISQGALQLDTDRVVDGDLVLPLYSSKFNQPLFFLFSSRNGAEFGRAKKRFCFLGQMNSAGVLRLPNVGFVDSARVSGQRAVRSVVCGVERKWAKELLLLTKAVRSRKETGTLEQAADIVRQVKPDEFVPVFGFIGVSDSNSKHSMRYGETCVNGCGEKKGRVAVFTDTNVFSASPFFYASLRTLDKLIYNISARISFEGDVGEVGLESFLRTPLSDLVGSEKWRPSFAFVLLREFVRFLYSGDIPEFTAGTECRSDGNNSTDGNDNNSADYVPYGGGAGANSNFSDDIETSVNESDESDELFLLSTLFAAAPRRVAVAEFFREAIDDWEAVSAMDDKNDLFFAENRYHFEDVVNEGVASYVQTMAICTCCVIIALACLLIKRCFSISFWVSDGVNAKKHSVNLEKKHK